MPKNKIIQKQELKTLSSNLRKKGKIIGLSHGVFDLIHPGHVAHFIAAKKLVDVLIVSITEDQYVNKGPGRPVFNQKIRMETLSELEPIDFVVLSENRTSVELIDTIKPHIYFKGSDYKDSKDDLTRRIDDEIDAVKMNGGVVHFTDEMTSSSSKLLNQYFNTFPVLAQEWITSFKTKYEFQEVANFLDKLADLNIVLTGEIIIDQYTTVNALAKSSGLNE